MLAVAIALVVAVEDARDREISNGLSAALALVGAGFQASRAWAPGLVFSLPWERALGRALPPPGACLFCAGAVLLVGLAAELVRRHLTGRPGMGLGDVKYLASWTCVLGPAALVALGAACLAGSSCALVRRRGDFALGPWVSATCCAVAVGACLA